MKSPTEATDSPPKQCKATTPIHRYGNAARAEKAKEELQKLKRLLARIEK